MLSQQRGRQSLWSAIVEQYEGRDKNVPGSCEPTIILLGSDNAGKSTLMSSFIYKTTSTDLKPTVGLDYKFIRTNSSSEVASQTKTVHHFWEIGGDRQMSATLLTLLTDNSAVLVVVDLSRPSSIMDDLLYWLPYIRTAATSSCRLQPQIVIIANKYDLIPAGTNLDLLFRTIRAVALHHNAAILAHGIDHRVLHQQYRSAISRFLTQRPMVIGPIQSDPAKPFSIPAASDSQESIGFPPGVIGSLDLVKSWLQAYEHVFDRQLYAAPRFDFQLEPEPLLDVVLS